MKLKCLLFCVLFYAGTNAHPPVIETSPRDLTVANGGIAYFVCKAIGNPSPQIEWLKNSKRYLPKRYKIFEIPNGSVLRIEPVFGIDGTQHECVAKNGVGEPAVASAHLNVLTEEFIPLGFPGFLHSPFSHVVEKGLNVTVPCQAKGKPEPTVRWLQNFIPLNMSIPRYSLVEGSLQITHVQEEDHGVYECVAENWAGTAISSAFTLYVRVRKVPPAFSIHPDDLYKIAPGDSLNVTCIAVGSPMPRVRWRKGSADIAPEQEAPIGRNVLVLKDITRSVNYTCVASSILGFVEVTTRILVLHGFPKPPTNIEISEVTYSSMQISWSYNSQSDNVLYYNIQYKPKFRNQGYNEVTGITNNFTEVKSLNPNTDYEFLVIAVNSVGHRASLPVFGRTEKTDPPVIETAPEDQTVANGGVAIFFCEAFGNPVPEIEWLRNSKKFLPARYSVHNTFDLSILRIEPARYGRDSTSIECVAKNSAGELAVASANLNVISEDSLPYGFPQFHHSSSTLKIEKGDNITLQCQVQGYPQPTVMWLKNLLPHNVTIPRHSFVEGSLQITDVKKEDWGQYECLAKNSHGSAMSPMTSILVADRRVPPKFYVQPDDSYEVLSGKNLNITCIAAGAPMPQVRWRKVLDDITEEGVSLIGINILILENITESVNYTCIASSPFGHIEKTAQIAVINGLPTPPVNVDISEITPTSVLMSWSRNPQSENVLHYAVQYKPEITYGEYKEISGILNNFLEVQDLNPDTQYEFLLLASNSAGRGRPSTPIFATTAKIPLPTCDPVTCKNGCKEVLGPDGCSLCLCNYLLCAPPICQNETCEVEYDVPNGTCPRCKCPDTVQLVPVECTPVECDEHCFEAVGSDGCPQCLCGPLCLTPKCDADCGLQKGVPQG